jgi:hypothetical protein
MNKIKLYLKKIIIIGLSAILIAIGTYSGFTVFGKQVIIEVTNNFLSISLEDVNKAYASAIQYEWINAIPKQTDNVNFEWINGNPNVYINVSSNTYDTSVSPTSKAFSVVAESSTYYAKGSAPSNPIQDSECTFTITNSGSQCDLDMKISDFTGGNGWNIVSSSPSTDEVRITAYYSGQNPASGLVLANTDAEFLDAFSTSSTKKFDFKMETGTFGDGAEKTATITITAVAED